MSGTTTPAAGQVCLPGQAAAPDGPVDLTAMFAMHRAFRRDLDRFVGAVVATPVTDRAAWRALAARWNLFGEILHDHHTGEDDGLWPELLVRLDAAAGLEAAAGRQVLAAMAAEHHDLDPLLDAVATDLSTMVGHAGGEAAADARAALEVRVAAARNRLSRHLDHEERDALALVQRHLSAADWERISETYFVRPKGVRKTVAVLAWVMHELPDPVAARLLGGAAPVRILWRLFLRRPFARRERRAFRYTG